MIARHAVGYRAYVAGEPDAMGNAGVTHAPAVERLVYAIEDLDSVEPVPGRSESVTRKRLYCQPGDHVDSRDRFVIGGAEYDVVGVDADWTYGPFAYAPGVVVTVRRAEG